MAKRTANQHRGLLGELAISELLSGFGLSVNSLTDSDFGLDLHGIMPEEAPFVFDEVQPNSPPWQMSSNAVHLQIKNTLPGTPVPVVKVDTLKSWIDGSQRTPVFVVISHIADSQSPREPYAYITPTGLKALLATSQPRAKTRSLTYENRAVSHSWNRRGFYARLHLWTVAPALMNAIEEELPLPDTYDSGRHLSNGKPPMMDFDQRVFNLLAALGHSYLHQFQPRSRQVTAAEIKKLVGTLANTYKGTTSPDRAHADCWHIDGYILDRIESTITQRLQTRTPALSTGSFTSSANSGEALADLKRIVAILSTYQPFFRGTRTNYNDPSIVG